MGHNGVVSGHLKSTGISWVDELLTGPSNLVCHNLVLELKLTIT